MNILYGFYIDETICCCFALLNFNTWMFLSVQNLDIKVIYCYAYVAMYVVIYSHIYTYMCNIQWYLHTEMDPA